MGLADVANVLWREREVVELLLFKLEEERLLIAADRTRWLQHATREVTIVRDRLRQSQVLRALEVDAAAAELGLPPGRSLLVLADAAPPPWSDMLLDHHLALQTLAAEVAALAAANREVLAAAAVAGVIDPRRPDAAAAVPSGAAPDFLP